MGMSGGLKLSCPSGLLSSGASGAPCWCSPKEEGWDVGTSSGPGCIVKLQGYRGNATKLRVFPLPIRRFIAYPKETTAHGVVEDASSPRMQQYRDATAPRERRAR